MPNAKLVQVSDDSGASWDTLPGGSGSFNNEAASIADTVFGQEYMSSEIGLIGWSANAQAFYKGFAGYVAKIKKGGTPTAMTGEAMELVSGKTYRVTAAAKRILDRNDTFVVYDNAVDQTAEVVSYDYIMGTITFDSGYTVTGPVTIDGDYIPMTQIGAANSFTLTQTAEAVETSDYETVQGNGGFRTFQSGLRTVALELSGFYDVTPAFRAALQAREILIIEVDPDGSGNSICKGFFKVATQGQSGDVGALEEETVRFELQVPSSDYAPFGWFHDSDTTLHDSIVKVLDAWINESEIDVQYLYDGTNGTSGTAIVTEVSLSNGLDNMNEFSTNFQGTGATAEVGTG